ncbi:MAG: aldolase/citrate lyase family protein [Thermoleophilia bacterium]
MKDVKQALARGETLFGPGVFSGSSAVVEIAGRLGFDWVFIDTEQSPTGPAGQDLERLIQAAYAADVSPAVRVGELTPYLVNKALNFGAKAIWVPHVETRDEAERLVEWARYPPLGQRGAAPIVRAAGYGTIDFDEYLARSNDEVLLVAIVESVKGVENVREIASVPGLDAICFGPFDLAVSMGLKASEFYGGSESSLIHPEVEAHARACLDACREHGLVAANAAWSSDSAAHWVGLGFRLILFGLDLALLVRGLRDLRADAARIAGSAS